MATYESSMVRRAGVQGLAGVTAALLLLSSSALAQNSARDFLTQEFQRNVQQGAPIQPAEHRAPIFRRPAPRRPFVDAGAHPAFESGPRSGLEWRRPKPVARPAPPIVVAVLGDRMGRSLAEGLTASEPATVAIDAQTDDGGGLTRPDFTAWLQAIGDRLHAAPRPVAAAIILGTNDRRPMPDGSGTADPASAHWQELYASRVDALAQAFREAGVTLIWLGLPAVRDDAASADFVRLNGIVRDRATKDGITFVDCWEGFIDEEGRFSPMGPDVEGQTVRLRKADGVGFTRAGATKLASFVEGDLKRFLVPPTPGEAVTDVARITIETPPGFDAALGIDVNREIRREAGLETGPAASAAEAARPVGPEAGPVTVLTAAPLAPGGKLAGHEAGTGSALPVAQASLWDGADRPSERPKPGRADDFSWPRP